MIGLPQSAALRKPSKDHLSVTESTLYHSETEQDHAEDDTEPVVVDTASELASDDSVSTHAGTQEDDQPKDDEDNDVDKDDDDQDDDDKDEESSPEDVGCQTAFPEDKGVQADMEPAPRAVDITPDLSSRQNESPTDDPTNSEDENDDSDEDKNEDDDDDDGDGPSSNEDNDDDESEKDEPPPAPKPFKPKVPPKRPDYKLPRPNIKAPSYSLPRPQLN